MSHSVHDVYHLIASPPFSRLEYRGKRFTCFIVGPVSLSTRKVIISVSSTQCKKSREQRKTTNKKSSNHHDWLFSLFLHHHHVAAYLMVERWIYSVQIQSVELEIALNLRQSRFRSPAHSSIMYMQFRIVWVVFVHSNQFPVLIAFIC